MSQQKPPDKKSEVTLIQCGDPKGREAKKERPPRDGKIQMLEVMFNGRVDLPPGFEYAFQSLIGMVTSAYEAKHPYRSMWISGMGSRPNMAAIFSDDHEHMFDDNVYHLEVSERPASPKDLEQRGYKLCDTTCKECGEQQFYPKMHELLEPDYVTCANSHLVESGAVQGNPIIKVHVLTAGLAVCMFDRRVPAEWPPNHKHIGIDDHDHLKEVNCAECRRRVRKFKLST